MLLDIRNFLIIILSQSELFVRKRDYFIFFFLLGFFAVFAAALKAPAVGAPLVPGFRIFSPSFNAFSFCMYISLMTLRFLFFACTSLSVSAPLSFCFCRGLTLIPPIHCWHYFRFRFLV